MIIGADKVFDLFAQWVCWANFKWWNTLWRKKPNKFVVKHLVLSLLSHACRLLLWYHVNVTPIFGNLNQCNDIWLWGINNPLHFKGLRYSICGSKPFALVCNINRMSWWFVAGMFVYYKMASHFWNNPLVLGVLQYCWCIWFILADAAPTTLLLIVVWL